MERANGLQVKKVNRNRIFQLVYKSGPISRQDISIKLGISLPTVSHNLKLLKDAGLITDNETFDSTGGRKAKCLCLNTMSRCAIGLDITKNHVVIVAVDLSANVFKKTRIRLTFENTPSFFEKLGGEVLKFIDSLKTDKTKILGVGISIPSLLSQDNKTVVYAPVIGFTGGKLEQFAQYIPYDCILCNDASAAGIAELWNADSDKNMIYLSLSNSVGGAILLNNRFYAGDNLRSGEFGHMTIVPDGKMCYCGQKGCVDAYCSAKILSESANGSLESFFNFVDKKSSVHCGLWKDYLDHLVIAINNLRMSFDCKVVLGGYIGAIIDRHINTIRNMAAERNSFECDGAYVEVCRYKLESSAVGAALCHIEPFIKNI